MSFFGRLFGKKKKSEPVVKEEKKLVEETPVVEEPAVEEEPVVEETTVVEEEPVVEDTPVEKVVENVTEKDVEVYEVKPHKVEGWQVIKKGAARARRRFSTQAECINYCREMSYKFELFGKDGEPR